MVKFGNNIQYAVFTFPLSAFTLIRALLVGRSFWQFLYCVVFLCSGDVLFVWPALWVPPSANELCRTEESVYSNVLDSVRLFAITASVNIAQSRGTVEHCRLHCDCTCMGLSLAAAVIADLNAASLLAQH